MVYIKFWRLLLVFSSFFFKFMRLMSLTIWLWSNSRSFLSGIRNNLKNRGRRLINDISRVILSVTPRSRIEKLIRWTNHYNNRGYLEIKPKYWWLYNYLWSQSWRLVDAIRSKSQNWSKLTYLAGESKFLFLSVINACTIVFLNSGSREVLVCSNSSASFAGNSFNSAGYWAATYNRRSTWVYQ